MPLLQQQPHDHLHSLTCSQCGLTNRSTSRFCARCGQPLTPPAEHADQHAEPGIGAPAVPPPPTGPPIPLDLPPPTDAAINLDLPPPTDAAINLDLPPPTDAAINLDNVSAAAGYDRADAAPFDTEAAPFLDEAAPFDTEAAPFLDEAAPFDADGPPVPPAARRRRGARWLVVGGLLPALALAALAAAMFLLRPVLVVRTIEVPEVTIAGRSPVVTVVVANEGRRRGEQELTLLVAGTPAGRRTVAVAGRGEETASVALGALDAGSYEVGLAEWEEVTALLWVVDTPELTLPDVLVVGDGLDAEVTLRNAGDVEVTREVVLLLDGTAVADEQLVLRPGAATTAAFDLDAPPAGTHTLTLAIGDWQSPDTLLWVMPTPRFDAPTQVVGGDRVELAVTLTNPGPDAVSHDLIAQLGPRGGVVVAVDLAAGEESTLTLDLGVPSPGGYPLTVRLGDWRHTVGRLQVLVPATFEIDYLDVEPSPLNLNDSPQVTVVADIANVGEAPGSREFEVVLDGTAVATFEVSLASGEWVEEAILIDVTDPGPHTVQVDTATTTFNAYRLERPTNGAVLLNQLGGGSNRLRIVNNRDDDALVVLTEPGAGQPALLQVYVRAGSSHTVRGIRSGTYETYYAFGLDWCTHHEAFTRSPSYGRFQESDRFTSTSTSYTQVTVEFGITEGAGSPTDWVSPDAFPTP